MIEEETIPCETCGQPTPMLGTKRCDGCWEVEHRLGDYMKHPKGLDFVRGLLPKLDDWVDGKPDAWDYEAVLRRHGVTVEQVGDGRSLGWRHGSMYVATDNREHGRKAAALFVELWLRGVSASFAGKLMDSHLFFLENSACV